MKRILLITFCFISYCSNAQSDNSNSFISFTNEGQSFSINNSTGIKTSVQVNYVANILQSVQCIFVNTLTNDTLLIVAKDEAGFIPGRQHIFSSSAKLLFYYKIAGKGILVKMMDNKKNEIKAGNNFSISKCENKPGAIVEGTFAFTDLAVQNSTGKTTAIIKKITNGNFRSIINNDIVLGNHNNTQATGTENNKEQTGTNNLLFTSLSPDYVIKKIFKPIRKSNKGYYVWKPDFNVWFDSAYLSDDGYAYTKYDTVLSFNDGTQKIILFFATPTFSNGELADCHACGALMSCAIFIKQPDNTYLLSKLDTNFDAGSAWGLPNPVELVKIGSNKYAVASASSDMHQGYYQESVSYFDMDHLYSIFNHQTTDDNTGAMLDKGYSNKTTIKFLPAKDSSEYYILQAITKGTEESTGGKIKAINKTEVYYFDLKKGEYVLQPKTAVKK